MKITKTILLPTDFSANSLNAINYAISMFGDSKCRFILMNAYRISPISIEEYVSKVPDFAKESEEGLKKMVKRVTKKFPRKKLTIETISKLGYPIDVMKKIIKRKNVDLAVMGTKGASGLKEVLVGSITSDAVKNLPCPVLAVPEKARYEPLKNIALAADLKGINNKMLFDPLISIGKNFSSEILIFHIRKKTPLTKKEKLEKSKLKRLFGAVPHAFHIIEETNAIRGIENFIKARDIDMVAMVSRKQKLLKKIFSKSATEKLAMHTKIPLLALQN